MSEREEEILKLFAKILPQLTERGKDRLLYFGEGMAFRSAQEQKEKEKELQKV